MTKPRFYNSLSKQVEELNTRRPGQVRIYNCGPTVYKRPHLGNMRRFLFADFLRRSLEFLGYDVREVTNITDVGHLTQDELDEGEDKLEKEARETAVTPQAIATKVTEQFMADLKTLNIEVADKYPKATDHIQEMQKMISQLIDAGYAYQVSSGVYYNVESFADYGQLSGNTLDKIEAGARVDVRDEKKHPADFALWKTGDTGHVQQWDSPWGRGYPGWHIECSAMSMKYLGEDIDIHTGGIDNKFPHHENEIAQSAPLVKSGFVRIWMHNAHLKLAGEKLAKRDSKQLTVDDLGRIGSSPLAFRLLVFASHYRSPIDLTEENIRQANETLNTLKQLAKKIRNVQQQDKVNKPALEQFTGALADDLNTPEALAVLLKYVRQINKDLDQGEKAGQAWMTLLAMDKVIGVIGEIAANTKDGQVPPEILDLGARREEARKDGNFKQADQLRKVIFQAGYLIEDTKSGPQITER